EDHGEQVVEVVRHATSQPPQALQAPSLAQLQIELALLGDVAGNEQQPRRVAKRRSGKARNAHPEVSLPQCGRLESNVGARWLAALRLCTQLGYRLPQRDGRRLSQHLGVTPIAMDQPARRRIYHGDELR